MTVPVGGLKGRVRAVGSWCIARRGHHGGNGVGRVGWGQKSSGNKRITTATRPPRVHRALTRLGALTQGHLLGWH